MESRRTGRCFIGTSGWNCRHWADCVFYPPQCKPPDWLGFHAGAFDAVEITNTFYHLPLPGVFARWHDVHAYFNNDAEGHAVRDACRLRKQLQVRL
jgi:uncharacterized protein YecE (DUF72 family)